MAHYPFWHVDAFTDQPFKGNPAAVFILKSPLEDALMQAIAVEMNLSETAFILLREGQKPLLRWFTPMDEIDFCGHATLAASSVYLTEVTPGAGEVTFDTQFVGPLRVKQQGAWLTIDAPSRPGEEVPLEEIPPFVLESLSPTARPIYARKARDLMLVYDDPQAVLEMTPNFYALMAYPEFIIVTAPSPDPQYDFISRFFCAADGILEDPVTGSAHCTLAPYWAKELGKNNMTAWQASKRSGHLELTLKGERLEIAGQTIRLMQGTLQLPD